MINSATRATRAPSCFLLLAIVSWYSPYAQAAVLDMSIKWDTDPSGFTFIPVCIDPRSAATEQDGSSVDTDFGVSLDIVIGKVRNAVSVHYERHSTVRFIGWDYCPAGSGQFVAININPNAANVSLPGIWAKGAVTSFKTWGNDDTCLDNFDGPAGESDYLLYDCVEQYSLHELGHVLGFYEEWMNPVAPLGCSRDTKSGNIEYSSPHDPDSLFNYNHDWYLLDSCVDVTGVRFGSPSPSPKDIEILQRAYGLPVPNGAFDVGVIPDAAGSCPEGTEVVIFMDNEDDGNANRKEGVWWGAIESARDTKLKFCRVDGTRLLPFWSGSPNDGASTFAVLKLGETCPAGSRPFEVFHDNEDFKINDEGHHSNWMAGQVGGNIQNRNTELDFCVFPPASDETNSGTGAMPVFPDFGFDYGVIASASFPGAEAGQFGMVYMDEEDDDNANAYTGDTLARYLGLVVVIPQGIAYHLAKVRANNRPMAHVAGPYSLHEGETIVLDGSASQDLDNDNLTYSWDFDDDGSFDDALGIDPVFSAATLDGDYVQPIRLRVSDGIESDIALTEVNIRNVAPTATFTNVSGDTPQGDPVTIAFSEQFDPSVADTDAGFTYMFDCGNGQTLGPSEFDIHTCSYPIPGEYTASGSIQDKDGGLNLYAAAINVLDTIAPVLTVPPDVRVTAGREGEPIGVATAIDVVGVKKISSDAPNMFRPGQTVVTWYAMDDARNISSATQIVTAKKKGGGATGLSELLLLLMLIASLRRRPRSLH